MDSYKALFVKAIGHQFLYVPKWYRDEESPNPIDEYIYGELKDFGTMWNMATMRVHDAINLVSDSVQHTFDVRRRFYKDMSGNLLFYVTFGEREGDDESKIIYRTYMNTLDADQVQECNEKHKSTVDYDIYMYERNIYSSLQWELCTRFLAELKEVTE